MFSFFRKKNKEHTDLSKIYCDMHSHLLPGIDDGAQDMEASMTLIQGLVDLGYKKIITTPHIMTDYYGNSAESVTEAYRNFIPAFREQKFSIELEFAAEYYVDESVIKIIAEKE